MLIQTLGAIALGGVLAGSAPVQTRPAPAPRPATAAQAPAPKPEAPEAQAPQPAPRAEAARPEPPREREGQPVNIRLELTIADQTGAGEPSRKVITMIVADRQNGFIRSKGMVRVPLVGPNVSVESWTWRELTINVDARPTLLKPSGDGNIRVDLGLEYQPTAPGTSAAKQPADPMSNLNERVSVIVEPGKPLTISQAADPASDRRISVELKATTLK